MCVPGRLPRVAPMTISHDVTGDGPTVVLLHSTVCDRRMWDPQVPALVAAGHRVVRCDFRGFGNTPMPDRPTSDADDVVELLDTLGAARVALVGASGGGRVALEIAAGRPDRVTDLALLCTAWAGHAAGAELRAIGAREDALLEAGDVAGATELNVRTWVGPAADDQTRDQETGGQGAEDVRRRRMLAPPRDGGEHGERRAHGEAELSALRRAQSSWNSVRHSLCSSNLGCLVFSST